MGALSSVFSSSLGTQGSNLSYSAELKTYIGGLAVQPSTKDKNLVDWVIQSLKSELEIETLVDGFDLLYLPGGTAEIQKRNLVKRAHDLLEVGTLDFQPYKGFKSDGLTGHIRPVYNPANDAEALTLNSAAIGYFIETGNTPTGEVISARGTHKLYMIGNTPTVGINQSAFASNPTLATYSGTHIGSRVVDNEIKYQHNQKNILTETILSTQIPSIDMVLLARRNGETIQTFFSEYCGCFFASKGLTDEQKNTVNRILSKYCYYVGDTHSHVGLAPLPYFKQQHSLIGINNSIYAFGGINKRVYAYNILTDKWTIKNDLPFTEAARQSAVVNQVGDKLYFIGGLKSAGGGVTGEVFEYTPETDTYIQKASMTTAREDCGSAVHDGKIYCFGGVTSAGSPTNKLEIYDVETDSWSSGANMPNTKETGNFGCYCNGKIYAISAAITGYHAPDSTIDATTECFAYDIALNTWSTMAAIPVGACYRDVVAIGNKIYAIGGVSGGPSDSLSSYTKAIYEYDTETNTWTRKADAPYALLGAATCVHNNKIYTCGGGQNFTRTSDTLRFYEVKIEDYVAP